MDIALLFFLYFAPSFQGEIEEYYSKLIYPQIVRVLGFISDSVDFSITEIIFYLLIIVVVIGIFTLVVTFIKKRTSFLSQLLFFSKLLIILISMIFISFYLFWGINFYRLPLDKRMPFLGKVITKEQYYKKLDELIENSKRLVDGNEPDFSQINLSIEKGLAKVIEKLDGTTIHRFTAKKRKHLYFNILIEKMLISGFTSPFLNEIHLDKKLFPPEIPFVLAHEKAHLHGYTGEGEAEFIAYLSCRYSDDPYCNFSGEVMALEYFLFNLDRKERIKYWSKLHPKIVKLYKAMRKRYMKNVGLISELQSKLNDSYLKANRVTKGVEDYSELVNLILRFKEDEFLEQ